VGLAALDIKRIIEKTEFDIIRPQWIHDCVRRGQLVPFRKKYFFHAPPGRLEDEEYDLSDSEDESEPRAPTTSNSVKDEDEVVRALETPKASSLEVKSEHSEWFKLESSDPRIPEKPDGSETEDNDSDNHDLDDPDLTEDDDEWFSIPNDIRTKSHANASGSTTLKAESPGGFDVVEVPQIRDVIVGLSISPTFVNV